MKNLFLLLLISVISFSCEEKKIEFIQSPILNPHLLIKNPPKQDFLLENEIKKFLIKNPPSNPKSFAQINFYNFTPNTKYFLEHEEDPGGFSSEELSDYPEDKLAVYIISKCKNDSTQLVGRFHFYGLKGSINGQNKVDTLIYKCK